MVALVASWQLTTKGGRRPMTVRFDYFGLYRGREYRVVPLGDDQLDIVSNDPAGLLQGFQQYSPGVYAKRVNRQELEAVYSVETYGLYRGHRFQIPRERDGKLLLVESLNTKLAADLGFTMVEPGVWEKWVSTAELDRIWEEKSPF